MGTGTSRLGGRAPAALRPGAAGLTAAGLAAVVLAGCGGGSGAPFAWLHPQPPPPDWKVVRVPGGAALAYPANWTPQRGDRGTATAALIGPEGRFLGYLNLTPRQGDENLSNWTSFRPAHNREEGDRGVKRLSGATGLRFLTGRGSCVKDSYTTSSGSPFVEIACLIEGRQTESVIVGAAPPGSWGSVSPTLQRSIEGLSTNTRP